MLLAQLVNFDSKKLLFEGFVDNETEGLKLSEQKEELKPRLSFHFLTLPLLMDSAKRSLQWRTADRVDSCYYSITFKRFNR